MLRMNGSAVFFLHRSELEECITQQADIVVKVPTGQHWRTGKVFNLKKSGELSFRYGTLQHERTGLKINKNFLTIEILIHTCCLLK